MNSEILSYQNRVGEGKNYPENGIRNPHLPNGLQAMQKLDNGELLIIYKDKKYKTIVVNWSHIGCCVTKDGINIKWYDSWKDIQEAEGEGKTYPENGICNPHLLAIITESTFESYDPIGHNETIDEIYKNGNIILTISPRNTAHKRFELGKMSMNTTNKIAQTKENQKKKEESDVTTMFEIVREAKTHLKVPQKTNLDYSNPAKVFEYHRRHDDLDNWTGAPQLPDPTQFSDEFKKMWCIDSKMKLKKPKYIYDWKIVAPMYIAYLNSNGNKKIFERLVGCNGTGYPSFARATWYRRIFSTQMNRRAKAKKGLTVVPKMSQTDARRVTRQLFHLFNQSTNQNISSVSV